MIFKKAITNSHYRTLCLVSEKACWEMGFSPYQYGMRLRMGRKNRPPAAFDFCLGHDATLYAPVLMAVLRRLEAVDESAEISDIDAKFPWVGGRPDLSVHLQALLDGRETSDYCANSETAAAAIS